MSITSTVAWNGSTPSRNALRWAIERERSHGGGILLLSVIDTAFRTFGKRAMAELSETAERALAAEIEWIGRVAPAIPVESLVVVGDPESALPESCPPGSVLVIGVEDRPARVKRWSLTARITALAGAPVVIVPSADAPDGRGVVVGFDGSPSSREALRLAAGEAQHRGEPLHIVHVWPATGSTSADVAEPDKERQEHEEVLRGAIQAVEDEFGSLEIEGHLDPGPPAAALARRAAAAVLLVVGSRGHGPTRQLILGAVSRSLVLDASGCPVVVVHAEDQD